MRALYQLPRAAPILLRHLSAYADLFALEFARSRVQLVARVGGILLVTVGLLGSLALGCAAVIAVYWDTPHRLTAIYILLGAFMTLAIAAAAYTRHMRMAQPPLFAELSQEWRLDRAILSRLVPGAADSSVESAEHVDERQNDELQT